MKHKLTTSFLSDYTLISGSDSVKVWQTEKKRVRDTAYSGGFGFMVVYHILNKFVPVLKIPQKNEHDRFNYGFKHLYLFRVFNGSKVWKYDIIGAYRTILSIFVDNIEEKERKKIKKQKKQSFNRGVGYCAYHYELYNNNTGEIFEKKEASRPDILYFCTTFLKELKYYLSDIYKEKMNFVFVDSFGFSEDIDFEQFREYCIIFQKKYYEKNGLFSENFTLVDFHREFFSVRQTPLFTEFYNEKETKKYFL